MEEDSQTDLNAESNSKIVHFLANLIMSGRKEAPSLSQADSLQANRPTPERSSAMQFEVSKRNKIIINFVNFKGNQEGLQEEKKEEEKEAEKKKREGEKSPTNVKKGFFGRLFSGSKKEGPRKSKKDEPLSADSFQKNQTRKFENVKVIGSQSERERLFREFHRTIYHTYIQKITKIIHKHENIKISSEVAKMHSFLRNSSSTKELQKALKSDFDKLKPAKLEKPEKQKKEGIIKEESFENLKSSELENWYFDLESLSKIVDCLN